MGHVLMSVFCVLLCAGCTYAEDGESEVPVAEGEGEEGEGAGPSEGEGESPGEGEGESPGEEEEDPGEGEGEEPDEEPDCERICEHVVQCATSLQGPEGCANTTSGLVSASQIRSWCSIECYDGVQGELLDMECAEVVATLVDWTWEFDVLCSAPVLPEACAPWWPESGWAEAGVNLQGLTYDRGQDSGRDIDQDGVRDNGFAELFPLLGFSEEEMRAAQVRGEFALGVYLEGMQEYRSWERMVGSMHVVRLSGVESRAASIDQSAAFAWPTPVHSLCPVRLLDGALTSGAGDMAVPLYLDGLAWLPIQQAVVSAAYHYMPGFGPLPEGTITGAVAVDDLYEALNASARSGCACLEGADLFENDGGAWACAEVASECGACVPFYGLCSSGPLTEFADVDLDGSGVIGDSLEDGIGLTLRFGGVETLLRQP